MGLLAPYSSSLPALPLQSQAFRLLSSRQSQSWYGQPSPFLITMPFIQVTHSSALLRWPNQDFNSRLRPRESGLGLMADRNTHGKEQKNPRLLGGTGHPAGLFELC